ncbi:reactive intermediate/imine deaminase [Pseudoxanthomonas sp. GM95]|uniref:RidA family protein n=1 Tax=Pseudoxanthomonas sp. GM95 TaxID=1881043 RepID=UPI0008BCA6B5|nr:RidA family protein [Pseudoxanthomonas sp. GM95]SEL44805.1 reactive intermediate/imine deaminase [Pseudoxanthomonas sp. GM95]
MTCSRSILRAAGLLSLCVVATAASAADLQYFSPAGSKAPYSAAVRAGDTLYVSGQLGVGADGKLPEDFDTQASNTMANVGTALGRAGLSMDDVAQCTVMIVDMAHWAAFNKAYTAAFKPEKLPARSAMAVTALPMGALLEVDCKAYAGTR